MHWYLDVLKRYVDFNGRAGREEFWMFFLFNLIISFVLAIVDNVAFKGQPILGLIYNLAVLLPSLGVAVRRLHDTGKSGWMILVGLIPCVGVILLIVWYATAGEPGSNQYGPNPTGRSSKKYEDE